MNGGALGLPGGFPGGAETLGGPLVRVGEPPPPPAARKGPTRFASTALPARRPDPARSVALE
jgi:hypothetical protein